MNLRQRWKQTSLPNKVLATTGAVVALSSVAQLIASNAALQASIESSHNEQRAWVAIQSIAITTLESGKPLRTEMKIINTGKTVAIDVDYPGVLKPSLGEIDVEKVFKETPQPAHAIAVLFPGIDETVPAETPEPLTQQHVDAIKDRRLLVYFITDIHYKDIFKKEHITQFCGLFVPAKNKFEACHQHNKVD
jgi:hypothetical protein